MVSITNHNKTPVVLTGVLFFIFLAVGIIQVCAQDAVIQNDLEHKVNLYNVNGKPWANSEIDVAGTPFFLENWKVGKLRLIDNNSFINIRLRLNLQEQQVHFLQPDNVEMFMPAGSVREITFTDSTKDGPVTYTFQCGFPVIDNLNQNNFYLVLCNGRIKFLKSITKKIHQEKDNLSGEVQKEYRQYEDFFFLTPGEIKLTRFRREKSNLLVIMQDKHTEVEAFMEKNKLSYKSAADIQKLVDYYNSLF